MSDEVIKRLLDERDAAIALATERLKDKERWYSEWKKAEEEIWRWKNRALSAEQSLEEIRSK